MLNLQGTLTPCVLPMPRFAVLNHDHPFPHWDLLLEQGAACRTWRLMQRPDSPGATAAEQMPDHRLMYLDYEGPISGGRGRVTRWDWGTFEWLDDQPDRVVVRLQGRLVSGIARLDRVEAGAWDWNPSPGPNEVCASPETP